MTSSVEQQVRVFQDRFSQVVDEVSKVIVGNREVISNVLTCLLVRGHVLLEGIPGVGKTKLVQTLSDATDLGFSRIQFTPDLMPGDIIGSNVVRETDDGKKSFEFQQGPVFTNILLADEINRATPKTQSALLEAMQEKQVTIGGESQALPNPFFVMATQNPVEQEGTYPLPEAQRDRFLFKLIVDYPEQAEEFEMMKRWGQVTRQPELKAVSSGEELLEIREEVDQIHVSEEIQSYILKLVRATRRMAEGENPEQKYLSYGASPRASLSLFQAGRALAWLRGQDHVSPSIIKDVFLDAMRHRVGLTYEAEAEEITPDDALKIVLDRTPLPTNSFA